MSVHWEEDEVHIESHRVVPLLETRSGSTLRQVQINEQDHRPDPSAGDRRSHQCTTCRADALRDHRRVGLHAGCLRDVESTRLGPRVLDTRDPVHSGSPDGPRRDVKRESAPTQASTTTLTSSPQYPSSEDRRVSQTNDDGTHAPRNAARGCARARRNPGCLGESDPQGAGRRDRSVDVVASDEVDSTAAASHFPASAQAAAHAPTPPERPTRRPSLNLNRHHRDEEDPDDLFDLEDGTPGTAAAILNTTADALTMQALQLQARRNAHNAEAANDLTTLNHLGELIRQRSIDYEAVDPERSGPGDPDPDGAGADPGRGRRTTLILAVTTRVAAARVTDAGMRSPLVLQELNAGSPTSNWSQQYVTPGRRGEALETAVPAALLGVMQSHENTETAKPGW
ncbi:hypothetical protein ON010_g15319 [Phytophthora cinnamomi]|nr:hypothetical protein ON010_g15319 [Phytophthora cinnamomi]